MIDAALRRATLTGRAQPVLCGSSFKYVGVQRLLDAVAAAENGLHGLSLRAVRDALKGGPPVTPIPSRQTSATVIRTIPGNDEPPDPALQLVVKYVAELEPLWERHQAPPGEVYEALREVVLPALGRQKKKIAELLGVSRQTLCAIVEERSPVTPAMALRLGKLCGNGATLWLNLQRTY